MTEQKEFHVFLSHNSRDKDSVRIIGQKLEKEGIRSWLDERKFVGGAPWQKELYEALDQTKVVFFFLGINGVGPWQEAEIDYLHNLYISSRRQNPRIVPIFLPGASIDNLPSQLNYLKEIQFVTLNNLEDNSEIGKLLKIFQENNSEEADKTKEVVENNIQDENAENTKTNSKLQPGAEVVENNIQGENVKNIVGKLEGRDNMTITFS